MSPRQALAGRFAAAALVAGMVSAATAVAGDRALAGIVGAAAVAAVAGGIWRRRASAVLAGVGLALVDQLVSAYVGHGSPPAVAAAAYGIGCFLAAELGCSACEPARWQLAGQAGALDRARAGHLGLVLAATAAADALAIVAGDRQLGGSMLELGGLVGSSALVLVAVALARRRGAAVERRP